MGKKRVFVAIDISSEARDAVSSYIDRLCSKYPEVRARWVPPGNLHLTVRFVGHVDEAALGALGRCVDRVTREYDAFTLTLAGTGNFARRKIRADALWIGATGDTDVLANIAAGLDEDTHRKHIPHLTIARIKDARQAKDLVAEHVRSMFRTISFPIDEVLIYESTLKPTGPVYSVLSRHRLGRR